MNQKMRKELKLSKEMFKGLSRKREDGDDDEGGDDASATKDKGGTISKIEHLYISIDQIRL